MTSMTGHGRGESRAREWSVVAECFSVNRKTAEVVLHCERGASWLEPVVRERVLSRIARGRVQVNLSLSHATGASGGILDAERAAGFVREASALQKKLSLPGDITISDVLSAPGVVRQAEPSGEGIKDTVLAALDEALDGLSATRAREGKSLQTQLRKTARNLRSLTKKIAPLAAGTAARHRESLRKRVAKAGLPLAENDPRLLTEIVLLAERADITEELHRAESHIAQFLDKLESPGPTGRTLEFLAQELGREFNTMGAKSSDAALAGLVIEAKADIDRIREQLANIE